MNQTLFSFQDTFVQALLAEPAEAMSWHPLASQPGFAVYRNTVMKAWIDALQANFPAVLSLVGETWFRAAAAVFVRCQPPQDTRLLHYGAHFPAFLRDFEPAQDLPYLCAVAHLDHCWTQAHLARDAAVLSPAVLASMPLTALASLELTPHPAAHWAWHDDGPMRTLWQRNRDSACADDASELTWSAEGVLITRPEGLVQWVAMDAAGCAFLDACQAGQPLAQAAACAQARDAQVDLAALMAALLGAGAFSMPHLDEQVFNRRQVP